MQFRVQPSNTLKSICFCYVVLHRELNEQFTRSSISLKYLLGKRRTISSLIESTNEKFVCNLYHVSFFLQRVSTAMELSKTIKFLLQKGARTVLGKDPAQK